MQLILLNRKNDHWWSFFSELAGSRSRSNFPKTIIDDWFTLGHNGALTDTRWSFFWSKKITGWSFYYKKKRIMMIVLFVVLLCDISITQWSFFLLQNDHWAIVFFFYDHQFPEEETVKTDSDLNRFLLIQISKLERFSEGTVILARVSVHSLTEKKNYHQNWWSNIVSCPPPFLVFGQYNSEAAAGSVRN